MAEQQAPPRKLTRKSLNVIAKNANTGILFVADRIVDKLNIEIRGKEIDEIQVDWDQRKELDEALTDVLEFYLPDLGPLIAYSTVFGATLASRYKFSDVEPKKDKENGEADSTSQGHESGNGVVHGKAGDGKDDNPESDSRKGNTKKKVSGKRRSSRVQGASTGVV